ncbi:MAG: hypothetical protein WA947_19895 [Phormidesmis sp.]
MIAVLMAAGGWGVCGLEAIAQSVTEGGGDGRLTTNNGAVFLDNNAFDFRTGPLENDSNIPLPSRLPRNIQERQPQEVDRSRLAPNTIELTTDVEYIEGSLRTILQREVGGEEYTFNSDSLELETNFDVRYRPGDHSFGEGIQATVIGPNGERTSQDTIYVRGDRVTIGPGGRELPVADTTMVRFGANDVVEIRVLNIRENGNEPNESAIYFSEDGEFVVEDLQNGGDLDFDDGEYVQIVDGQGNVETVEIRTTVDEESSVTETPLDPEIREEVVTLESDTTTEVVQFDEVVETDRDFGEVGLPDAVGTWLGHASGVRTEDDEQLIYSRYTNESQFRLGSDGITATGQLKPLIGNPKAPPTLLNGNLNFNPFVGDNEAGFTGTLGITQYLTRTHRVATDAFGNEVISPDDTRLLQPTGLFTNQRIVGYVPDVPAELVRGVPISSVNGIIDVPSDSGIAILPPDPSKVGRGDSAYTDNVGGLLLADLAGNVVFVPQWNSSGYSQDEIDLPSGAVRRIIYALVPQQAGQNLTLGQTYAVSQGANGYLIEDGGFTVISADQQPENFAQEMAEVYAVEDTLAKPNASTSAFNGIRGVYAETLGGARIPTVDVTVPSEADARVGNEFLPQTLSDEEVGQPPVVRNATRALGFYLDGGLTAGIGNQEDSVTRSIRTMEQATDQIRRIQEVTRFSTPLTQRDEVIRQVTETARRSGVAFFDVNENGELSNVRFDERERESLARSEEEIGRSSSIERGEEERLDATPLIEETTEEIAGDMIELDQRSDTDTDSYANFSAVRGEIALGSVLNFGNTPWTTAANTVRAELFAQDTVIGRSDSDGVDTGWRAELAFHPFGEVKREAFRYDETGAVVPVYRTETVRDAAGNVLTEVVTDADGNEVEVAVNAFVIDENGEKVMDSVGTGVAKGPGVYLRVQDLFDDNEGVVLAGGVQYSF